MLVIMLRDVVFNMIWYDKSLMCLLYCPHTKILATWQLSLKVSWSEGLLGGDLQTNSEEDIQQEESGKICSTYPLWHFIKHLQKDNLRIIILLKWRMCLKSLCLRKAKLYFLYINKY